MDLRTRLLLVLLFSYFQIIFCFQRYSPALSDTEYQYKKDGWSSWTEWSTCSRSCGGGIAVQSRRCLEAQGCDGSSVRYNICSPDPCPDGSPDFYWEQCSQFNSVPFNGELHEWEPARDDTQPCSLSCRAKGMNSPPVTLSARVLDGTRCGNGSERMCVHGQCQTVGCDGVLGSGSKVDPCGVCGGDGGSCSKTEWLRRSTSCSSTCGGGYSVETVVCRDVHSGEELPDEECVHTLKPAPGVINCGEKPCPAHWQLGHWQECSVSCGFGYQLREVACVQWRNSSSVRVADYECGDPRPPHRRTCEKEECPRWFEGIWSECSVTCDEGVQRRAVQCRLSDGQSSTSCDFSRRPESTRPCRTGVPCASAGPQQLTLGDAWKSDEDDTSNFLPSETPVSIEDQVPVEPTFIAGEWSDCSASCGEGIQTREVTCKIFLEFSRTVALLPDTQCHGHRPVDTRKCSSKACDSDTAGESETNPLQEVSKKFSSLESQEPLSLADEQHGDAPSKVAPPNPPSFEDEGRVPNDHRGFPASSANSEELFPRIVPLDPKTKKEEAHSYDVFPYERNFWKFDRYTECSEPCLGGVQEAIINCIRASDHKKMPTSLCDQRTRPQLATRACNDHPCPPFWEESDFEPCSKSCGGGIMRRKVRCVQRVTTSSTSIVVVPDSYCHQPSPYEQKFCNLMPCQPRWIAGKWSQCSVPCGRGFKTRKVRCIQTSAFGDGVEVEAHRCPPNPPSSRRGCSMFDCKGGVFPHRRRKGGPVIKALATQRYKQKKFMKTVNLQVGGEASVFHGAQVRIKCPVRRFDRHSLTWWRDGARLGLTTRGGSKRIRVNKNGVLKIHQIQYTDAAVYICRAGSQEANITLQVQPLPSSFSESEDTFAAKESSNVFGKAARPSSPADFSPVNVAGEEKKHGRYPNGLKEPFWKKTEESDGNGTDARNRPLIFGKMSHLGTRSKSRAPTRGISLLSDKVALSKKMGGVDGKQLFETEEGNFETENGHIYGTMLNASKMNNVEGSSLHFGTLLRELEATNPASNPKRHHRGSSKEELLNGSSEKVGGELFDLFADAAADTFSAPQFLGKGTKDSLQFEWKITNWTECSQTCSFSGSSGGYQVRSTQCLVRVKNVTEIVDGSLCEDAGLKAPPTIQQCGSAECPQWRVSDWTDCENSQCFTLHYAFQTREVICLMHNSSEVNAKYCDDVTKPRYRRECYNRQCVGVWRTGDWSRCTAPCDGEGYRTRLLQCVWNGTKKSAGNACREQPRPEVVRWCDGPPCPKEPDGDRTALDSECHDTSRYCQIVKRINMCRVKMYRQKCCKSCQ